MYIFDLEGTLSDHRHRSDRLPIPGAATTSLVDPYEYYHEAFKYDKPNKQIVKLARECRKNGTVIVLTGMMEKHRHDAEIWLRKYNIAHDGLYMRGNSDFRPSEVYKYEWIKMDGRIVTMAFDDREKIVNHLLNNSIPAILVNTIGGW